MSRIYRAGTLKLPLSSRQFLFPDLCECGGCSCRVVRVAFKQQISAGEKKRSTNMAKAQSFLTDYQKLYLSGSILQVYILACFKKSIDLNNFNSHSVQSLHFNFKPSKRCDSISMCFNGTIMPKGKLDLQASHFLCCRSY